RRHPEARRAEGSRAFPKWQWNSEPFLDQDEYFLALEPMTDLDINDRVLAELRSASDIVEVIGERTTLKKAGRSWKGLCPFHNERTPSFTVDREKGLYHCFGCGAGGDVIHFVRQIDRMEFPEAVEALASRFGVAIPRRARGPREDAREKLIEAVA